MHCVALWWAVLFCIALFFAFESSSFSLLTIPPPSCVRYAVYGVLWTLPCAMSLSLHMSVSHLLALFAQDLFYNHLGEEPNSALRSREGVYSAYEYLDGVVVVILLDCRTFQNAEVCWLAVVSCGWGLVVVGLWRFIYIYIYI
jgi:hypothetical protein